MKSSFFLLCILLNATITSNNVIPETIERALHTFYKNKKVLVTGGCGFIGSTVAEKLVSYGADVTILDNLSTGTIKNIASIQDDITVIKGDIRDFQTCMHATKNSAVIFHLAAYISVPGSVMDPKECYDTNVGGTLHLLEAARQNNVTSFILSSSSAVYGEQEGIYSEDMSADPQSPYGDSKFINELCCKQYSKHYNLHTVMLRYFNVFGPKQNPHSQYAAVIAKFRYNMEHNIPITLFGDGTQTRDFVSVDTVSYANIIMPLTNHNETKGEIFNIASGKSISLLQLIAQLKKQYPHYTEKIVYAEPRPGDVKHTAANTKKLQTLIAQLKKYIHNKKASHETSFLSLAEHLCSICR